MAIDIRTVLVSLGTNALIGCLCLSLFSYLRIYKYTRKFYCPKRFSTTLAYERPCRLPATLLTWLWPLWKLSEKEIVKTAGVDAAIYMRIISYGCRLFILSGMWTILIVLPTNFWGGQVRNRRHHENGVLLLKDAYSNSSSSIAHFASSNFDQFSMANIPHGSRLLWVHLVSVYLVTYIALKLLWVYTEAATELRSAFLVHSPPGGQSFTVLLTDIPGVQSGTMLDMMHQLLESSWLRFLPKSVKRPLEVAWEQAYGLAATGYNNVSALGGLAASDTSILSPTAPLQRPLLPQGEAASDHEAFRLSSFQLPRADQDGSGSNRDSPQKKMREWDRVRMMLTHMSLQDVVESEMQFVYGRNEVLCVNMVHDESSLSDIVAQYTEAKGHLEDVLDEWALQRRKRKSGAKRKMMRVIGALYGKWGLDRYGTTPKKVDAIEFYAAWLEELLCQIKAEQVVVQHQYVGAAFVTFRDRWTQVVAATSLHCRDASCWRMRSAPEPREVLWHSLHMRGWELQWRAVLVGGLFAILLLFSYIPVAAIQGLLQIEQLDKTPIIKEIVQIPRVRSLILGILPGLSLRIFIAILPSILWSLNSRGGFASISDIEFKVVSQYFGFQIAVVFFGSFISGSLLNQFTAIQKNPKSALKLLGVGAPQTASFFILYIIFNGLAAKPISLLRVASLVTFWFRFSVAATERARRRLWELQTVYFGYRGADHAITIFLGLVYCCINPLILLPCLAYFIVAGLVEKYQLVYVFTRTYESGGRMWIYVFHQVLTGVYLFQWVMIAVLSIKRFEWAVLLLPCVGVTALYHNNCSRLFDRPLDLMSLQSARETDIQHPLTESDLNRGNQGQNADNVPDSQILQAYVSPSFKVDEREHRSLIEEASNASSSIPNGGRIPFDSDFSGDED